MKQIIQRKNEVKVGEENKGFTREGTSCLQGRKERKRQNGSKALNKKS
jgi:hypothetical protein